MHLLTLMSNSVAVYRGFGFHYGIGKMRSVGIRCFLLLVSLFHTVIGLAGSIGIYKNYLEVRVHYKGHHITTNMWSRQQDRVKLCGQLVKVISRIPLSLKDRAYTFKKALLPLALVFGIMGRNTLRFSRISFGKSSFMKVLVPLRCFRACHTFILSPNHWNLVMIVQDRWAFLLLGPSLWHLTIWIESTLFSLRLILRIFLTRASHTSGSISYTPSNSKFSWRDCDSILLSLSSSLPILDPSMLFSSLSWSSADIRSLICLVKPWQVWKAFQVLTWHSVIAFVNPSNCSLVSF